MARWNVRSRGPNWVMDAAGLLLGYTDETGTVHTIPNTGLPGGASEAADVVAGGGSGGSMTLASAPDIASANLPALNPPLATALAAKTTTAQAAAAAPVQSVAGRTIGTTIGFRAMLPTGQTGTYGAYTAFQMPDLSGTGISSRTFIDNQDAGASVKSKTPFCDSSNTVLAPTSGSTQTIAANIGTVLLNAGATIASLTITLPTPIADGQKVIVFSVYAITALAVNSSGNTVVGAPSALAASGFFTMKFIASINYWIRVG